ncbi:hypothetical protein QHH03_32265, partial [Aphanizomenon sp. 202]|nr:hypothetical protein [Aphanizomenon sp. 202]
ALQIPYQNTVPTFNLFPQRALHTATVREMAAKLPLVPVEVQIPNIRYTISSTKALMVVLLPVANSDVM